MRRWPWQRIAWLCALAAVAWLTFEIWLAGRGTPDIPPATMPIVLRGGHVQGNRITTKSWSFDYTHAQMSPDNTSGTVDGVRNGVIFKHGKPYAKISAEHLSLNLNTLDFTAIGRVHLERVSDAGSRSFDTDLVVWTNNAKLIRMDHPSYVHSGEQTLKISNITIDLNSNEVRLGSLEGGVQM